MMWCTACSPVVLERMADPEWLQFKLQDAALLEKITGLDALKQIDCDAEWESE